METTDGPFAALTYMRPGQPVGMPWILVTNPDPAQGLHICVTCSQ